MKEEYKKLIEDAKAFWSNVAKENNWELTQGVTVWIDKAGNLVDSLYNPEGSNNNFIVNAASGAVIECERR